MSEIREDECGECKKKIVTFDDNDRKIYIPAASFLMEYQYHLML